MKLKIHEIIHPSDKDAQIKELEKQIQTKKYKLKCKETLIQNTLQSNAYLQIILGNVKKYNEQINFEKQQQTKALHVLHDYIQSLKLTNTLSQKKFTDAKQQQSNILREIQYINQDLDLIKFNK